MPSKPRPPVVSLLVSLLLLSGFLTSSARERGLSFEERVRAQEAIERVYYSHQLEAAAPFEKAVPRAVLEAKVTRYLKQSAALEEVWRTPVTGAMLEAELRRIASRTRDPERLREIYSALGDDSILIQECFARAALVERLTRSFFEGDRGQHAAARDQAEALAERLRASRDNPPETAISPTTVELIVSEPEARPGMEKPRRATGSSREVGADELAAWRERLPSAGEVSGVEERADSFVVRVVKEVNPKTIRFDQYVVEKESQESWWQARQDRFDAARVGVVAVPHPLPEPGGMAVIGVNGPQVDSSGTCSPGGDSWDNASLESNPLNRSDHTAVWTGSLMLVWGGDSKPTPGGARYDPLTDTWTPMNNSGAPENRSLHTAVWTGTEMVIWGGRGYLSGAVLNSGGRYNPATDTWANVSPSPTLGPRYSHTAVWTGSGMIILGGRDSTSSGLPPLGSRYNPATDSWTPISTPGWLSKFSHSAVWTGTQMLIWGGSEGGPFATLNGGVYNPVTDSWSNITNQGAPPAALNHSAVWTGSRMIVWGGEAQVGSIARSSGGIYDPATDSWIPTSMTGAPLPRARHRGVWTGTEMIVWGGNKSGTSVNYNSGARFNPILNAWTPTNVAAAPTPMASHTAIWTGSRMLVGGSHNGARYDPATDSWTAISLGSAGRLRSGHTAVWTGNLMIVWGGSDDVFPVMNSGDRYDPLLDTWTPTDTSTAPTARTFYTAVWTGSHMVIWGGNDAGLGSVQSGARYDPVADAWSSTTINGAPSARSSHTAVWSGTQMIVWGGLSGGVSLSNGARYNPVNDTWQLMTPTGAPTARFGHSAVWAGNQMLVWGGGHTTGGRYIPFTDQWFPMSTANAPSPRFNNTAVWSGSAMLIWGGTFGTSSFNTGAGYDPATDTWTTLPTSGAPAGRSHPGGVWSGAELIVWGGLVGAGFPGPTPLGTGGRYNPALNQWTSTTLEGAPSPRSGHTAVWTGRHMIIWGADVAGGRYAPSPTDADADGFSSCAGDCDDARAAVHPGAAEACDGLDNDCDGITDEGFPDNDTDGYANCNDCSNSNPAINPGAPELCNGVDDNCDGVVDQPDFDQDGFDGCSADCNDLNAAARPGAPEVCNGFDDDCDGLADEGFADADSDGYLVCNDCNDSNPAIHPHATEICNGVDDDCNTLIDEGFDGDSDGVTTCAGDCNDTNPSIRPNAVEQCNGIDDNCNNIVDTDAPDPDNDGYGQCVDCAPGNPFIHPGAPELCNGQDDNCDLVVDDIDADGDGYLGCGGPDCRDLDPAVHPGATEVCNGVDDNCNISIDEGPDADGDGYNICFECDDGNPAIHPGAAETCNGIDDDCDQALDEVDNDGDGAFGCGADCDDANPYRYPGATEVCNLWDDDCDFLVDEGFDSDGDGFATCNGDCNDADPSAWDFPFEVMSFQPDGTSSTDWVWDAQAPLIGPGTVYDVASGTFGPGGIILSAGTCEGTFASPQFTDVQPTPGVGQGRWFLVRSKNSCGVGTYGTDSLGGDRPAPVCP